MVGHTYTYKAVTEERLYALAQRMALVVKAGDVLCLKGPVGAGKTTFARALIKHILIEDEDIPSPTFTLVQTYETKNGPLWHADLYRVGSSSELEELGLTDAFEEAICLIEWPEIMDGIQPAHTTQVTFEPADGGETRRIGITSAATHICNALEQFEP